MYFCHQVSRQQQKSLELCDHLDHSNKKVTISQAGADSSQTTKQSAFWGECKGSEKSGKIMSGIGERKQEK